MVKKEEKKTVELPKKKESYFPKLMIAGSILFIVVGGVNLIGLYGIHSLVTNILLILAGIWLLVAGINKGFSKSHREILKKYI